MDPLDFKLIYQYDQQQRKNRYDKHNASRRRLRVEDKKASYSHSSTTPQNNPSCFEQNKITTIQDDDAFLYDDYELNNDSNNHSFEYIPEESNEEIDYMMSNILNDFYDITSLMEKTQSDDDDDDSILPVKVPLHNYTIDSTYDYCEAFTIIARQANLCKRSTNSFLSLIKSGLPVPNNMPSTEEALLLLLGVEDLFTKRCICLLCCNGFDYEEKVCPQCRSTDKKSIAYAYDSNIELIVKKIMIRLSSNINEYKKSIKNNHDPEKTRDIPFGTLYQSLLKKNGYQDLVSLLLHVDGISITNSTKLKLWLLSGSILELPPNLRSRRSNMVIISIWIAYIQPPAKLWLTYSVNKLEIIKARGIDISKINHKLIIFGLTGDCPALSLVTNFINHNGYFSCWFCFSEGQYLCNKLQYRYEPSNLRTTNQYLKSSNKAERTQSKVYGHLGESVLSNIFDVKLPAAVVLDYLHVTLLGHAKLMILCIYQQVKPVQREELNLQLNKQFFPHFFNRKLQPIDNFGFVKATEVRNILFYGLLPHLHSFLSIQQYSHLALYVCTIRLLHSGHIFNDQTSQIAHQLFIEYYKDHELFYKYCQHLKLHLHGHFASLYETHGSLCNLGCFGQESFIGFVSASHHGTRYYGDSITHFYNIDFAIQNKKQEKTTNNGPYDLTSVLASNYDHLKNFHAFICTCNNLNSCFSIYRRFIIQKKMFHSLMYNKRHNSISYFIQYSFGDNLEEKRFGIIDLFFMCNGYGYAVIKYYRVKELFSNTFKNSSYYSLLKKPIDHLYFIVEKDHCQLDIILTDQIMNHCVVVEKDEYLFLTNILSYNEHD